MKATYSIAITQLKYPQFWLLAIGAGLIAIHLTATWKAGNSSLLGSSLLFWSAVSFLVWEKRYSLVLESEIFSSFFGLSLIGIVLIKSVALKSFGLFLFISPFICALGLALLASGFIGLKQYQKELLLLFFLDAPKILPSWLIDISPLTAKFAAFILWCTGADVTLSGVTIYLPTGSVEVLGGCSGMELIFHMLGLALLFLLMVSTLRQQKFLIPIVAGIVGFFVNGIRVVLMTVLVTKNNQAAFEYWHHGNGSLIFSIISVLIFGLFCWFFIGQTK
ncbi:cyanoexosortase A [Scytonema hofmannii PCC 7110]|uniref:Cyanoexosortase A n=1 Tax=Scytonema hofmannii PCC 7110 TaxID=128403 RepID=A0A139XA39_9CYAN|nr:cyanoexosortase A [Scytonema hofmannii]KYC41549.1 cyanoexosortase A [Scytonema hofmannii PCC 7110]